MKVLLVNPSSRLAESSRLYSRFLAPLPPQGIAYVAAMLEKNGIKVSLIDQYARNLKNIELVKMINEGDYNIVGFSCLTSNMSNVEASIGLIKKLNKKIKIVLGNIHPTVFADELLRDKMADFIVRGEGEYSMLELASALRDRKDLTSVKGISFRDNGSLIHNADREPVGNLDELPYPAWHFLDLRCYKEVPLASLYGTAFPIQASRGCPYKCIFCAQEKLHKLPRYRNVKSVVDELEYMNKKFNVRIFGFNDAYFPFSYEHGMEFCNEVIRRGLNKKIVWGTELRIDQAIPALLKKMKEAGVHIILYGFEVGNQNILDSVKKKVKLEQAYQAMRFTKENKILTLGLFILGLPGENKETCEETIRFAKKLDCDFVKFNIAIPFPGSEFYEMYKHKLSGKLKEEPEKFTSWFDWANIKGDLVYTPDGMTSKELLNIQRKAMFTYYIRPHMILRHLIKKSISLKNLCLGIYMLISRMLRK